MGGTNIIMLNSFKQYIREKWIKDIGAAPVFINPTRKEYTELLKLESYSMRMWIRKNGSGDVIVFPGDVLHNAVVKFAGLNIRYNSTDLRAEYFVDDHSINFYADNKFRDGSDRVFVEDIENNKNLKRFLPKPNWEVDLV